MSPSSQPTRESLLAALNRIVDPRSGQGLADAGLASSLSVEGGRALLILEAPAGEAARYAPVRDAAEKALAGAPGIAQARVILTAETGRTAAPARRGAKVAEDPRAQTAGLPPAERLPFVRRVIAVASGKGGVGKSTVAVNLACAFAAAGARAGLLDADIYGPSAPRMLGLSRQPVFEDGKLTPLEAFGVQVMSIGFIVPEGQAMIWRGPMATSALRQMIGDVRWGSETAPLDVLIVDLPPGTGDVHLTLVQKLAVDGAVIVSTPQEIALIDARRAAAMFARINPPVPILGVVENMAYFPDPSTGARIPIFGEGGARREAERLGVPFLAEIPLDMALREGGDDGVPAASVAGSPAADLFSRIAAALDA